MLQKFLIVCAAAFFLTIAITSIAKANGGPHGDYTTTTDACAGCHRIHTGQTEYLLQANDEEALCLSCHGAGATGANTNVEDGLFAAINTSSTVGMLSSTVNSPLIAGGFVNYKGSAVTSKHNVGDGITLTWGYSGTVAGTVPTRGVAKGLKSGTLECSSCHNPHGSTNYRLLNTSYNSLGTTVTKVDEGSSKNYTKEHWAPDMGNACDTCHTAYHALRTGFTYGYSVNTRYDPTLGITTTTRFAVTGTGAAPFSHATDRTTSKGPNLETIGFSKGDGITVALPLADKYYITETLFVPTATANTRIVCETCHLVHGSSAAMTGFAAGGPTGTGSIPGMTTSSDSALLRADNRGVCEACHQK